MAFIAVQLPNFMAPQEKPSEGVGGWPLIRGQFFKTLSVVPNTGMAVTVEPGIYIRPDALDNLPKTPENEKFIQAVRPAFEKYKGIGVRIEDDVLITAGDPKILSAAIPSQLEEVEAALAKLRQAVKTTPMP